jgi:predicted ATPase
MILRRIHVENWRCIRELDLTDLPEGIVVLHGPNRTGKSSLALALRACLFDSDHDTSGKEIKYSIPWNGDGPPKVVVEFDTCGATYRLTKIFSKKKEGTACLHKKVGPNWQVEQAAPKEASRPRAPGRRQIDRRPQPTPVAYAGRDRLARSKESRQITPAKARQRTRCHGDRAGFYVQGRSR